MGHWGCVVELEVCPGAERHWRRRKRVTTRKRVRIITGMLLAGPVFASCGVVTGGVDAGIPSAETKTSVTAPADPTPESGGTSDSADVGVTELPDGV